MDELQVQAPLEELPLETPSSALMYQLTSPRAVKAFLVILFGLVTAYLAIVERAVPEIIGYALSGIIGYYFGDGMHEQRQQAAASNPWQDA